MDALRGVGRDGVLCQLPEVHPIRGVRTPPTPQYLCPRVTQGVSIATEGPEGPTRPQESGARTCGHMKTWAQGDAMHSPMWGLFPVPTSTNFLCQASRMAPAFSSLQLMSWIS